MASMPRSTPCLNWFRRKASSISANGVPLSLVHPRMDSTVSNNLNAAVCQQEVNQNAIVVFGIPNMQLRKDLDGTLHAP